MTVTNIRADNALVALVEAMLPRSSGKDGLALYIRIDLRVSHYGFVRWKGKVWERSTAEFDAEREGDKLPPDTPEDDYPWPEDLQGSSDIHFLVYRPTNYTQVYALTNDSWSMPTADDEWLLYSDHDSCWKTDGFRVIDKEVERLEGELVPLPPGQRLTKPFNVDCSIADVKRVLVETSPFRTKPDPKHRRKVVKLSKETP
jgi:hypothetical protein